ncbi:bifunctional DNA primase/polymerase [Promicromonospora panici]|uniref:bifunctional DNA primase/polymerase n=1 Tax=Promicromonospora panici TaxID=2219658 RepID=UPI00101BAB7F|nr:bifunctional DNA primase/polymerase [Promicromonospora panici]
MSTATRWTSTHAGSTTAEHHRGVLLATALEYANRGWHVFPLTPGSKRPATPRHTATDCDHTDPWCRSGHTGWEQRATTNPDRITRAWTTAAYGVGIACGPSGLLVIDTDTPKPGTAAALPTSGEENLASLVAAHDGATLPATWTVTTPSGGVHRYYTSEHLTTPLGNTAGRLGALIDTRGTGGYVVAPPTVTDTGRYEVTADDQAAPLPAWLVKQLTPRPAAPVSPRELRPVTHRSAYLRAVLTSEARHVSEAAEGGRNHALFAAACCLGELIAGGSLTEADATGTLLDACAGHIAAGAFTEAEAFATVRSGFRRGAAKPRTAA